MCIFRDLKYKHCKLISSSQLLLFSGNYVYVSYRKSGGTRKDFRYGNDEFRPRWWPDSWPWHLVTNPKEKVNYTGPGSLTEFFRSCVQLCLAGNHI